MKETELEFYAYLGLLSVKFSRLDYNLSLILGKLLGTDENLIAITLLERNSLSQNIELLKKINRIRDYQEPYITKLIEQISKIKANRNLFIHGIWGLPHESNNETVIDCEEKKIKYSVEKSKDGRIVRRSWTSNEHHIIRISYIKSLIKKIEDLLIAQDYFIKKLENEIFI